MDWLLAHPDDMGGDAPESAGGNVLGSSNDPVDSTAAAVAEVALSLVCAEWVATAAASQ